MNVRPRAPKSRAMTRVREAFEQWRRTRPRGRSRIPDHLWAAAVASAQQHGVYATARLLRLDYLALKKRLPETAERQAVVPVSSSPGFIELPIAATPSSSVIELESPTGGRLRLRIPALTLPELMTLTRSWNEGRLQ